MFWRKKEVVRKEPEEAKVEPQVQLVEMPEMVIKEVEQVKPGTPLELVKMPDLVIREAEKPAVTKETQRVTGEKLPGPEKLPDFIEKYLVLENKQDPQWVDQDLRAVIRARTGKTFDIRVFSDYEVWTKNAKIRDYTSFDKYPTLILYEGWFDKGTKRVELEEKRREAIIKVSPDAIFTEDEIWQLIVWLREPGSSVYFYTAVNYRSGGPLGKGAVIVELNPSYQAEKQKRYYVYTSDVSGTQFCGPREKIWEISKSKDIAKWIKERHYKP